MAPRPFSADMPVQRTVVATSVTQADSCGGSSSSQYTSTSRYCCNATSYALLSGLSNVADLFLKLLLPTVDATSMNHRPATAPRPQTPPSPPPPSPATTSMLFSSPKSSRHAARSRQPHWQSAAHPLAATALPAAAATPLLATPVKARRRAAHELAGELCLFLH
jgi:hypothetical protein